MYSTLRCQIYYKIREFTKLRTKSIKILFYRINRYRTSIQYIDITVDGVGRRGASNGRTVSIFVVDIKEAKFSKISIWHV